MTASHERRLAKLEARDGGPLPVEVLFPDDGEPSGPDLPGVRRIWVRFIGRGATYELPHNGRDPLPASQEGRPCAD